MLTEIKHDSECGSHRTSCHLCSELYTVSIFRMFMRILHTALADMHLARPGLVVNQQKTKMGSARSKALLFSIFCGANPQKMPIISRYWPSNLATITRTWKSGDMERACSKGAGGCPRTIDLLRDAFSQGPSPLSALRTIIRSATRSQTCMSRDDLSKHRYLML